MKCFVIMPFGNPQEDAELANKLTQIYEDWIKPTVEGIQLTGNNDDKIVCHRGDKDFHPGDIITHIIENLVSSEIVIADLTGRNPNVFYELGVRHATSNNTILIAENLEDIPFDLRGLRTISYEYTPGGMRRFEGELKKAVEAIISTPEKIDNPVRRYLYENEIKRIKDNPTPPGYDALKDLIADMSNLKKEFSSQVTEVRKVMQLVTMPQQDEIKKVYNREIDLHFFEGVWKDIEIGSTFYAKIIGGNLQIPYCYETSTELTAHYYNCRLVGDSLFARFEWFNGFISGYGFFTVESENRLTGGWWYSEDLPFEMRQDISRINSSIPGMYKRTIERQKKPKNIPKWVEREYITKKKELEKIKKNFPFSLNTPFKISEFPYLRF